MINNTTQEGRIVRDIDLKYTPAGDAVCEFSVGVNDGYGDKQKSYFFDIVAWKGTAEYLAKSAKKGDLVVVSGRLTQERWEKDGQKRNKVKIIANDIVLFPRAENTKQEPYTPF